MSKQIGMFKPKSEWVPPMDFPNIKDADKIAIDLETKDPNIIEKGPGWATNDGEIIGVAGRDTILFDMRQVLTTIHESCLTG
jgi:hypothetical protein